MSITRSRQRRQQRLGVARLVVIAAAVVTVAGVAAMWSNYNQKVADATGEATSLTPARSTASPETGKPTETLAGLGDSWFEGTGAKADRGMLEVLARELDAGLENLGSGGTGYLNPGPEGSGRNPLPERVGDVVEDAPETVIVSGGLNDYAFIFENERATVSDFRNAVRDTLAPLARRLSGANVLVVGPFWPTGFPPPGARELDQVVSEVADDVGLPFVSPIEEGWITGQAGTTAGNVAQFIGEDGAHPTSAGHKHIAKLMGDALTTAR